MDKKNKLKQSLKLVIDNDNPQAQQVIKVIIIFKLVHKIMEVRLTKKLQGTITNKLISLIPTALISIFISLFMVTVIYRSQVMLYLIILNLR